VQFAVALEPAPELAVITSQTCDIDEQGLPRRKPWIQCARLVSWKSGSTARMPLV
jgi:hypothetical protein